MADILLTVGTRKGLFVGRRRGGAWKFDEGPYFRSQAVYSVAIDMRGAVPVSWSAPTARTGVRPSSTPMASAPAGPSPPGPP